MNRFPWRPLTGIILGLMLVPTTSGQTTFRPDSGLSGMGVARSADGALVMVPVFSGRRQAAPMGMDGINPPHESVAQRNRAIRTIRVGSTRAQLMRLFDHAGGYYAVHPGEGVYSYIQAPNIKVRVGFDPKTDRSPRPTDRITRLSEPYWETVAYD